MAILDFYVSSIFKIPAFYIRIFEVKLVSTAVSKIRQPIESFFSWIQEKTNYPREIAEAALAHSLRDKAEAAYARSDLLEKRAEMMEAWAQFISADSSDIINIRA